MQRANNDVKRRIVIAIKTTGNEPDDGHRMTEIACVEMMGLEPTGNNFHTFLFPGTEDDNTLMDSCKAEYEQSERLQKNTNAARSTIAAMRKVPRFTDVEAASIATKGVPEYLQEKLWQAPEFSEIETDLMKYLRMTPDTVVVSHDMGRLKKFFRNEMTEKNWAEFEKQFHDPKHGMMQKTRKFRAAGLYAQSDSTWSKNLGFEPICMQFGVSVKDRTRYSAMQDALMMAEALRSRKEVKMKNIQHFPKSKFFREQPEAVEPEAAKPQQRVRRKR